MRKKRTTLKEARAFQTSEQKQWHNPLGIVKGDLSTRIFSGRTYHLSLIAPTKKIALERASHHRGGGALVRVIKVTGGWGLYTR